MLACRRSSSTLSYPTHAWHRHPRYSHGCHVSSLASRPSSPSSTTLPFASSCLFQTPQAKHQHHPRRAAAGQHPMRNQQPSRDHELAATPQGRALTRRRLVLTATRRRRLPVAVGTPAHRTSRQCFAGALLSRHDHPRRHPHQLPPLVLSPRSQGHRRMAPTAAIRSMMIRAVTAWR